MQKYKCNNCGSLFVPEDFEDDNCPRCGSSNVAPNRYLGRMLGLAVAGICAAVAGYFVTGAITGNHESKTPGSEQETTASVPSQQTPPDGGAMKDNSEEKQHNASESSSGTSSNGISSAEMKFPEQNTKMVVRATAPKVNSSGTYSLTVIADGVPQGATVTYDLLNAAGTRVIAQSSSGQFFGVKGDPSGRCIARATARKNGTTVASAMKVVNGFAKNGATEESVGNRLSAGAVNGLFSSGALRNFAKHPGISSSVSVRCSGLRPGDSASSIADVYQLVKMRNASASVVGVGYDASGKVNSIQFQITYNTSEEE